MRLRLALVLAALLLAAGCRPSPPADDALVLRIYEVPKGTARPVLQSMKDAFYLDDTKKNVGRASLTPDGRIAVLAPANMQVGVRDLVEGVEKSPPKPEQTIELHYFVVVGTPSASAAPPPDGVTEIQPALDEINRSQGPQKFTLAKRIGLAAMSDEEGRLNGDELEIRQRCSQTSDSVYALLTVRYGKTDKLETRVQLAKDRIVVLGATGQHGGDSPDGSTLYYIVRVEPDGHAR